MVIIYNHLLKKQKKIQQHFRPRRLGSSALFIFMERALAQSSSCNIFTKSCLQNLLQPPGGKSKEMKGKRYIFFVLLVMELWQFVVCFVTGDDDGRPETLPYSTRSSISLGVVRLRDGYSLLNNDCKVPYTTISLYVGRCDIVCQLV